jgi:hypothetical protein
MNPILRRVLLAGSLLLIALAHYYATWLRRGGLLTKLSVWLSTVIIILLWYRWYETL